MAAGRPSMRCAARPGNRARESAMLVSGSLPMSSALTTSTMEVDALLVAIDVSIEWRMPVTTTSSSVAAGLLRSRRTGGASEDRSDCGRAASSQHGCALHHRPSVLDGFSSACPLTSDAYPGNASAPYIALRFLRAETLQVLCVCVPSDLEWKPSHSPSRKVLALLRRVNQPASCSSNKGRCMLARR